MADDDDHHPQPIETLEDSLIRAEKFRTEERMAWVALISVIVLMGVLLFFPNIDRLTALNSIVQWFTTAMIGVLFGFLGVKGYGMFRQQKDDDNK